MVSAQPRPRARRQRGYTPPIVGCRPRPEWLESRVLPAPVVVPIQVGQLGFSGSFVQSATTPTQYTATGGRVLLGFEPAAPNDPFQGLLDFELGSTGAVTIDTSKSAFSFTSAEVELIVTDTSGLETPIYRTNGATTTTWDVQNLTSSNGQSIDANAGLPFTVKGFSFELTGLSLVDDNTDESPANAEVDMQGKVQFPSFGKVDLSRLSVAVDGDNYLIASKDGYRLTGLTADLSGIKSFDFAGLTATLGKLSISYSDDGDHDRYQFVGSASISTKAQDASNSPALSGVAAGFTLSVKDDSLDSLGLQVGGSFKILRLQVAADPSNPIDLKYNKDTDEFAVTGALTATLAAPTGSTQPDTKVGLRLGYTGTVDQPGVVIRHGTLTRFDATVTADFSIYGIKVSTPKGLTFDYDQPQGTFELYGGLIAMFNAGGAPQAVVASLGDSNRPGIVVTDGHLTDLNISLSGQFNFFGLAVDVNNASVVYSRANDEVDLSGSISLTKVFQVSAGLGSAQHPGIVIKDGHFQLDDITLRASNIDFGAINIQQVVIAFQKSNSTDTSANFSDYTFSMSAIVSFPEGWEVGAAFRFRGATLDGIDLFYEVTSGEGIAIGDTGLFVTYIDASLQNLADPSNIIVHGALDLTYGGTIKVFGLDGSAFVAQGDFTVDRDHLQLAGGFYFGAQQTNSANGMEPKFKGLVGQGTGAINLDWSKHLYTATIDVQWYDGVINVGASFAFDGTGDFIIQAHAALNVPENVPFIGGDNLGDAEVLVAFSVNHPERRFVAAWVTFDVDLLFYSYDVKVGVLYNFDNKDFKVIGGGTIDSLANYKFDTDAQYDYVNTFNLNSSPDAARNGATAAELTVTWPQIIGTQSVEVTMPDGTIIKQADFNSGTNGLKLVPQLTTGQQTTVLLVNPEGADLPLPAGLYKLTLVSSYNFDTSQVKFAVTQSYPAPVVAEVRLAAATAAGLSPATALVPVTARGTIDQGFQPRATITLYQDDIEDTDASRATPIAGAVDLPAATDGPGKWMVKATWDTSRLLPVTKYFVFAVINDGTNPPVSSFSTARSAVILPLEAIYGTVRNTRPGPQNGQPIAGVTVYVDLNQSGHFDAGEPQVTTNQAGFYNFSPNLFGPGGPLQLNTPYDIGVIVPAGYLLDTTNSENTNPRPHVIYTGQQPNDQDFGLYQPASISGTVFRDLANTGKRDANDPGIADQVVQATLVGSTGFAPLVAYTDANGNYSFRITTPGTYRVTLVLPATSYASTPGTLNITVTSTTDDPYPQITGQDFGEILYSSIQGTVTGDARGQGVGGSGTPLAGVVVTASSGVFLNAGGGSVSGYGLDGDYSGTSQTATSSAPVDTSQVANPAPLAVYQSNRFGQGFAYTIPGFMPGATETVRLDFNESYWTAAGKRVFDVAINGQVVLSRFDIWRAAGGSNRAIARIFTAQADSTGTIQVQFTASVDNALVCGVAVTSAVMTTTTDANGNYSFTHLVGGSYIVAQTLPTGYRQAQPVDSDFRLDNPYTVPVSADPATTNLTTVVAGNFLNDGGDVAVLDRNHSTVWVYPNRTPGQGIPYRVEGGAAFIVAGDFLATGRQDIGIVTSSGRLQFLINDGPGSTALRLSPTTQINFGAAPQSDDSFAIFNVVAGKFDPGTTLGAIPGGDQILVFSGYKDYFNAGRYSLSEAYYTQFGFSYSRPDVFVLPSSLNLYNIVRSSLDVARASNGYDDVLIGGGTFSPIVYSLSRGTYQIITALPAGGPAVFGDMNGDGRLDAGVFEPSGSFHYAIQDNAGNYVTGSVKTPLLETAVPANAVLRDVNGDGLADVAWTGASFLFPEGSFGNALFTLLNTGQPGALYTSAALKTYNLNLDYKDQTAVAAVDLYNTGLPDLIVTDLTTGILETVQNGTVVTASPFRLNLIGTDATGKNFIDVRTGAVTGRVFADPQGNGVARLNLPGVAGATVFLDLNRDGKYEVGEPTATTGPTGFYSFATVAAGDYSIRLLPVANRRLTTPAALARSVSTTPGAAATDANFGLAVGVDAVVAVPTTARGDLTLARNGDRLELLDGRLGVLASYALADLNSITIAGAANAANALTIRIPGGGFFSLPGGVSFLGAGTGTLSIVLGAGVDDVAVGAGTITIDAGLVCSWAGVAAVTVNAGAGDDRIVVTAPIPTAPLFIDGDAGNDSIDVAAIDSLLTVHGGDDNDNITVGQDSNAVLVPVVLNGDAGDDALHGGPRGDTLIGGPGDDVISGGTGNDQFAWSSGDGNDRVDGGGGLDTAWIVGSPSAPTAVVLTPSGTGALVQINDGQLASLGFNSVETLNLFTGAADDLFVITPLAGTSVNLDGGGSAGDRLIIQANAIGVAGLVSTGPQGGTWTFGQAQPIHFANIEQFANPSAVADIEGLYATVLGRLPSGAEIDVWVAVIAAGATPADLARDFWESPEHRALQVRRAYATYLNRAPDPIGEATWVAALLRGASEAAVARGLVDSVEYRVAHPTFREFIAHVYRGTVGRAATATEQSFWTRAAAHGASRSAIFGRIARTRSTVVRLVTGDFEQVLGRAPRPAEVALRVRQIITGRATPKVVAERLLATSEFRARFASNR